MYEKGILVLNHASSATSNYLGELLNGQMLRHASLGDAGKGEDDEHPTPNLETLMESQDARWNRD